jgi:hypothetical protein
MRGKHKIIAVLGILILLTGCSSLRKSGRNVAGGGITGFDYNTVITGVIENNITGRGLEIKKGTIELEGTEIEGKFGFYARLNNIGDFYCSVRGPLAIELVRILIVGNDVAVIDRFNKTVYTGKRKEILARNGLPENFMSVILGDMPDSDESQFIGTERGEVLIRSRSGDFMNDISVCMNEMKVCSEKIYSGTNDYEVFVTFSNFMTKNGIRYASDIGLEERKKMFHVKLSIDDIVPGYDSPIEFNLPQYKREAL